MRSSRTPSVARPTIATATRACAPGATQPNFEGFGSVADLFEAFFGGGSPFGDIFGAGAGRTTGPIQGGDVGVRAEIDLAEAAPGSTVPVSYEAVVRCEHCNGNGAEPGTPIETCPRCGGSGQLRAVSRTPFGQVVRATVVRSNAVAMVASPPSPARECRGRGHKVQRVKVTVDVPAGIADGQRMRVGGRGHAGEPGGPPGDLYVEVRVRRRISASCATATIW